MDVKRAVQRFTTTQLGQITRAQRRSIDLGRSQMRRLVEQGRLHPCGTHTFSIAEVGKPNLERRASAAALDVDAAFSGMGSMEHVSASHLSAAGLLGLDGFCSKAMKQPIELTVRGRTPVRRPGLVIHETREWRGTDLRTVGGVPCTSGMRTVIDIAEQLGERDLARALDSAECDRLLTIESLYRSMTRLGSRRGVALLRRVEGRHGGGLHSVIERIFFDGVRRRTLPEPESQVVMRADRCTLPRVDFLFRRQRLVAEVSGHRTHSPREQRKADAQRARRQRLLGVDVVDVVEFTSDDLFDDLDVVLDELAGRLALRR